MNLESGLFSETAVLEMKNELSPAVHHYCVVFVVTVKKTSLYIKLRFTH